MRAADSHGESCKGPSVRVEFGPGCFCGQNIAPVGVDPCWVSVETSFGKWQVWFCHANCFKALLTKTSTLDLSPAHF